MLDASSTTGMRISGSTWRSQDLRDSQSRHVSMIKWPSLIEILPLLFLSVGAWFGTSWRLHLQTQRRPSGISGIALQRTRVPGTKPSYAGNQIP
jgi:hypothetical protein